MEKIFNFIDKFGVLYVKELQELLRQPPASSGNHSDTKKTIAILMKLLQYLDKCRSNSSGEKSTPLLYAEISGETKKTILFYNHYHVKPPESLDEWTYHPFGATIDGGKIYARGAADNKGDLMARIKATKAFIQVRQALPLQVKFIIEGEPEIGSPTLVNVALMRPELFHADVCIWATGSRDDEGRLELTLMNNQCSGCDNYEHKIIGVISEAVQDFYQRSPIVLASSSNRSPIINIASQQGTPVIGLGIQNSGSRTHSSDENINTADFMDGIKLIAFLMQKLSGIGESKEG